MINWREYIESNPNVMYGKPVLIGTRIPVDLILEKLSDGESIDDLLEAYPRLSREGIAAVLAYADDEEDDDPELAAIIAKHDELGPWKQMTEEELMEDLKESIAQVDRGEYISIEDLEKEMEEW